MVYKMRRMFGMMPTSEVEIQKTYKDPSDLKITIQAGPHGYAILYADSSAEGKDIDDTSEGNLNRALEILRGHFGEITECQEEECGEVCEECDVDEEEIL